LLEAVKAEMLSCGFNNPHGNAMMEDNAYAEAQKCMLGKGFVHEWL
jgi:hypothetical protein